VDTKQDAAETAAEQAGVVDDAKVFLEGDLPRRVTLVNDETYDVPRVSFKREMIILGVIGETVGDVVKSGIFDKMPIGSTDEETKSAVESAQTSLLQMLFTGAPEKLAKIAAAICAQSEDWVGDNLDSESILELILPFLKHRQTRIVAAVARHTGNIQQAVAAVAALTPKK
jgi:hypothetical protein